MPSGYWKIISLLRGDELEVAGFVLDQEVPRKADFCDRAYEASVAGIAVRSGLAFTPELERAPGGQVNMLRARLGCAAVVSLSEAPPRS